MGDVIGFRDPWPPAPDEAHRVLESLARMIADYNAAPEAHAVRIFFTAAALFKCSGVRAEYVAARLEEIAAAVRSEAGEATPTKPGSAT